MTSYSFRLRFNLPKQSFIDDGITSTELNIDNENQKITMISRPLKSFKDSVKFDVFSDDFPSKERALSFGHRVKESLMVCCAILKLGIEIGGHEEILDPSSIKKGKEDQQYVQPEDLNGLVVFPSEARISHVSCGFEMKVGASIDKFQNIFSKSFDHCRNLDKKLSLAFELYNSHFFELSIRSKFLQLITIVECLAKQNQQSQTIIDHIDELICLSKKELSEHRNIVNSEIEYFSQRLNNLKRESISRACQNLVQQYLGGEDVSTFKKCYNIRSGLVHDGTVRGKDNLIDYYHKIDRISLNLLIAILKDNQNVS